MKQQQNLNFPNSTKHYADNSIEQLDNSNIEFADD